MGWLDLFKSVGQSGLSSAMDFGLQALGNAVLPMSKAQRQQNEYASLEAQKARNFSAQEAEINRDWQEEMYARYNSLQGKVAQAREAGINPLFAVTGSATSPMSANPVQPAPSSASPSSASPLGQISDMASSILGFSKIDAEIKNIEASNRKLAAESFLLEVDGLYRGDMRNAELNVLYKTCDKYDAEISYFYAAADEKFANIGKIYAETAESEERSKKVSQEISNLMLEALNIQADTQVKLRMFDQIGAQIENLEADTGYKVQLAALAIQQAATEQTKQELNRNNASWFMSDIDRLAATTNFQEQQAILTEWQSKATKRNYKWTPVMNTTSIVTDLMSSAGKLLSGVGSLQ